MSFPTALIFPKRKPYKVTSFLPGGQASEVKFGGEVGARVALQRALHGRPHGLPAPAHGQTSPGLGFNNTLLEREVSLSLASHTVSVQKKLSVED